MLPAANDACFATQLGVDYDLESDDAEGIIRAIDPEAGELDSTIEMLLKTELN